jgi:DNA-binding MarR family transcriptional regulator
MSQPDAIVKMTGHCLSRTAGRAGASGSSSAAFGVVSAIGNNLIHCLGNLIDVTDADARLANDLSLAVVRLARQLRFRRPDSPVSLSQLSALATLAKDGPMTPGALAVKERVRPPSMTRVIASLAELGFVDRCAHPDDGRQVLVSVSPSGADLIEVERRASREWLQMRLAELEPAQRNTLLDAADLMLAIVNESA